MIAMAAGSVLGATDLPGPRPHRRLHDYGPAVPRSARRWPRASPQV